MKKNRRFFKKTLLTFLIIRHFLSRYRERLYLEKFYFLKSKKREILIVLGGVILLVWGFEWNLRYRDNRTVSIGIVGFYNEGNLPPFVANLISQPLVKLDEHGIYQPGLAEAWQVSSDSAKYQLTLKKQLDWSDGTPVKSTDIKINLPDVEVSYPNENSLQFSLADSFSPFLSLLSAPVLKNGSFVGVGKYRVSHLEVNHGLITKLVLKAGKGEGEGMALPDIAVRFYPDEKTARTAFTLGEIDSIMGISNPKDYQDFPQVKFTSLPSNNHLVTVFYNLKDPTLSDKNMRRALNCALPIIEGEERAKTSIPPSSWAYNDSVKECTADLEAAKDYLSKVPAGKGNTVVLTTTPAFSALADKIIGLWKKIGISAQVRVENGIPQNFQVLLISEPIPSDPDQYLLWHSTQAKTNLSHYSFARVDKDLEDGRKISDLEIRKEKYFDLQKVLADDVPASFLYYPKMTVVVRMRVREELDKILKNL